jgi:glycosyltransferase involved in cell wall biosynthesis
MLRKLLRNRKLSKLSIQANPIIDMAIQHLDRPTDLKDSFNLNLSCDFDTLAGNQEAALICEKFDIIAAMDIRLATLRFFGSYKSSHVFQCLASMPELLNDQRALRSLHTYFNRLGLHEFAEELLGVPNFDLKKKNKVERVKSLFGPSTATPPKQKQLVPNWVNDNQFSKDMKEFEFNHLAERLVRHLSRVSLSEFSSDILDVLRSSKIDLRRRREILFAGGELLLDQNITISLNLLQETKAIISDARFTRRVAQKLEKLNRSEEAIKLLKSASDQTSQRLCIAIQERLQWKNNGYNIDYLDPVSNYLPVKDRVLYHVHASMNHTTSGYSTRTHHICKALIEQGVDLHVRTRWGYPCDRKEVELTPEQISTEVIDNVTYLHDPLEEAFGTYAMEDYAQRAAHSLLRTALEIKPSVIHAASNHAVGFPAVMVARALNIPFVYEMRGLWALSRAAKDSVYRQQDRFQLEMALERHVALAADHVIVITDGLRAQLVEWGIPEEKISLAPNGVDTSRFLVRDRDIQLEQELMLTGKTVIGYVGSLLKYEGLDLLLEAISLLSSSFRKDLAVLIVGDGEHRSVLESKSLSLNLKNIVQFTGKVPMNEVTRYYSLIDISPFPRISAEVCEMISPLKPLEAMAMGSVVLASNVRAIAEHVIPGKNGVLFEKGSSADLALKLEQLLLSSSKREQLSTTARLWVEERRNWPLITSYISNVYQFLLHGNKLESWKLDVLPAIVQDHILKGRSFKPEAIVLRGPYMPKELSSLGIKYKKSQSQWTLEVNKKKFATLPKNVFISNGIKSWPDSLPPVQHLVKTQIPRTEITHQLSPETYCDYNMASLYWCDSETKIEHIHDALSKFSILASASVEYFHGFVGIITSPQHLDSIFDGIENNEHIHQRKENWRRLLLRTHPFLCLLDNCLDRTHLELVDPLRYSVFLDNSIARDYSILLSRILTQRVLPQSVIFSSKNSENIADRLFINALFHNGIESHYSPLKVDSQSIISVDLLKDEHIGLDRCLENLSDTLYVNPVLDGLVKLDSSKINQRILVIGHDLKFITSISETWESWGVQVTLLETKNHAGDLNISQKELFRSMSNHDVIFCEWALGNLEMISELRGSRPLFARYHLQERNTEFILRSSLRSEDHITFVSEHTRKDETRISKPFQSSVTPNAVDCLMLNVQRNNPFGLGILGITPQRKRLDYALELLEEIKNNSGSTSLIIKGKMPKDFPWMKHRATEVEWYRKQQHKYARDFAEGYVLQEGFTPKIGSFFSSISTLVSVSDFESFHLAPVEAAAARANVSMLPWTGSYDIHRKEWIHDSVKKMAQAFIHNESLGLGYENGEDNRKFVIDNYDLRKIAYELILKVTSNIQDRRDTVKPINSHANFLKNLFPNPVKTPERMRIRTLVHEEIELPPVVDKHLRRLSIFEKNPVILAAHIDLNLIDGSAVWYASMATMLSGTNSHVICLLPNNALHSPLLQPLLINDLVSIITPEQMGFKNYGRKLSFDDYLRMISSIDEWYDFKAPLFCRGFALIDEIAEKTDMELWAYLTDYYSHEENGRRIINERTGDLVAKIAQNGGKILSQTELIADELSNLSGVSSDCILSLPPMIPEGYLQKPNKNNLNFISVIYAGKMAPLWGVEPLLNNSDEMFEVIVIGDKIHRGPASDSNFQSRMKNKLVVGKNIIWIPRLPREQVLEHLAQADLAWCARDAYFESQTRELSTKILEAILVGTPPIVTRSHLHEELLGKDWPFMLDSPQDSSWKIDTAKKISESEKLFSKLQEKLTPHDINSVSSRFKKLLQG